MQSDPKKLEILRVDSFKSTTLCGLFKFICSLHEPISDTSVRSKKELCCARKWLTVHSSNYPLENLHNYGKSPFLMGQSTISMAIFNSYVSLPEGSDRKFQAGLDDLQRITCSRNFRCEEGSFRRWGAILLFAMKYLHPLQWVARSPCCLYIFDGF